MSESERDGIGPGPDPEFRQYVAEYLWEHWEDQGSMREAMLKWGMEGICQGLSEILADGDGQDVYDACLLLRDLILLGPQPERHAFFEVYNRSELPARLEWHVLRGTSRAREECAYTLGKTWHNASLPLLRNAFAKWLEQDPLCLDRLLFEINWLEPGPANHSLYELMSASQSYFTRWALLERLDCVSDPKTDWHLQFAQRLVADPHPWVREEAEYYVGLRARRPAITFARVKQRFHNEMSKQKRFDYTLKELHSFIESQAPLMAEEQQMGELSDSWTQLWTGLGASGDGLSLQQSLLDAYAEPQRKYHTLQHLRECVALFQTVSHLAARPAEVAAALWFHDAVYDVHAHDNEAKSALWAREALREAGVSADATERVAALVMMTQHSAQPATADEQLLVDVDLSILGATVERFAEYEAQVRDEYGFVPEPLFRTKRGQILQAFLDRPRIFSTEHFYARLEQSARRNLLASIAALSAIS